MQPPPPPRRSSWRVDLSTQAAKDLDKLTDDVAARIRAALLDLACDPFRPGLPVKKLQGESTLRLRVGDYRVLYIADRITRLLHVLRIRNRKDAY